MNGGKPIKESRDIDLPLAAAHFFYYAGWADKLDYAFPGRDAKPIGVAGQVIPWNFPMLMAAWKLAPALATGNTTVLKPAETTPLTALLLAEVIQAAELPPGTVNVLTGAGETGAALVASDVDKVAFTGSTEVGKAIRRTVAGTDKRLTLELGGKAANIVFEDAPLDQAVEGVVNGIFFNQGHVCCAGSRLLVQEPIFEPLLEKLKARLQTLRVGDPLDKNTDIGAINSRAQLTRIEELVASGVEEGAEMYQPACDLPERGFWFRPTLFTGVSQSHRIAREEIFGPVLSILTFRTPEEAVEKANNTPYGLSAGVWTEKGSRILWMAERLRGRRRLGEHVQPVRPVLAVRGLQGVGLRARGRPARSRAVCRAHATERGVVSDERLPVRRTAKLYVGGEFPRSESGRSYEVLNADGELLAWAARASRKDLRDAVRAARAAQAGWAAKTAFNRGQILYRVAELMEGRRVQFESELKDAGAEDPREGCERRDRPLGLVRGMGRQDPSDPGRVQSGGRPVLQLHDPGAHRRGRDRRAAGSVAARAGLARGSRDRQRQHRGRAGERAVAAAGGLARGGPRDLGRAGRRRQRPHRPHGRARAVARRPHGRERAGRHRGAGRSAHAGRGALRGEREARASTPPTPTRSTRRPRAPTR